MTLPRDLSSVPVWLFAAERMDTWVFNAAIAIPLVCIAGLVLWHLTAWLAGKLLKKPRTVRPSPEPHGRAPTEDVSPRDEPERLQQVCAGLENSLASRYLELAESWLRRGQPQKAAAALKKILQVCPESHQAQLAQDRLRQIGKEGEDHPS